MADKKDKKATPDKQSKKDKKGKKGTQGEGASGASVANHPRAAQAVRRAKGFGGLAGFALAAMLARGTGLPVAGVLERALISGVAGYILAWACAVTVWRHLLLAEMKTTVERRRQLLAERRTISLTGAPEPHAEPPAAAAPPAG